MKKVLPDQKGFAHPLILVLVIVTVLLIIAAKFQVVKTYPLKETGSVQGVLVARGDEDSSGSSGSWSSGSSGSSSSDDNDDDNDSTQSSSNSPTAGTITPSPKPTFKPSGSPAIKVKRESDEGKVKTEIRFGEGERIKTKIEDGRTRVDVYSGGVKVRYEIRDGRVTIKAETEEGEDVDEQELFKIEDRLNTAGIRVATESGKLMVARNNIGALSSFPIQVDLNTNQLIASTSAGQRILTVLPDQAVQNLLAASVISRLDPIILQQAAQTGGLASVSDVVALGEINGVPVYEINGLRDQRLLGFIPVTTPVKVVVSAETGQTVIQEQSLLSNIVDILSP